MLFNKRLLQTRLNNFEFPSNYDFARANKVIDKWQTSIKNGNYDETKETRVQATFLTRFFNVILGYAEMHDSPDEWYLINEARTEIDSTKADGALGYFSKDKKNDITRVVIELKDAKTHIDKKQSSRKDYDTPVSQAFSYSSKFDRCDWIIVSNFKEIRLYHKDRGQGYYEKFEILDLHEEKEFKRFYFLFCKENLLDKERNSLLDRLVKDTSKNEEEISKEFYKDFKLLRKDLFQHICEHNPNIDKACLLEKTQKLLDRLIFIMFCEDTNYLLPNRIIDTIYKQAINSFDTSEQKVWTQFKGLFTAIDKGKDTPPIINAYNGGLFANDEILDNLIIKDIVWEKVVKLSDYDFESDLNVNILGHIFEQSLSDLEQLKAELDGVEQDKNKSKRKKDGIFYTPEYITRYIVEQTVGKYIEENPDKLESIKILDPACGSGAFINQAHSFLKEQYKIRTEESIDNERVRKRGGKKIVELNIFKHSNLAEIDCSILLDNLFGVDLNEESTEITKLALWLKTARKDQPLQNLDNNIKCGNSLIDDPVFAGNKAFNWNEQFKDIMNNGGFDVVIGNPPYVRQEFFSKDKPYLEKKYDVYTGVSDLYVYFFEKGLKLLKNGGYFAFIVSNKFLKAGYGKKLTQYLQMNYKIVEIIDFGDLQIFEGATTYPCIITIKKELPEKAQACSCLKLESLDKVTNLKQEVIEKGFDYSIKTTDDSWMLANKEKNTLLKKINVKSKTLKELGININYGIKTGFNEAFVINEETKLKLCSKDSKSIEIIKPLIRGQDIYSYYYNSPDLWVIVIPAGWTKQKAEQKSITLNSENDAIELLKAEYPFIYNYFQSVQDQVEQGIIKAKGKGLLDRDDKGDYWWELRPCIYYNDFEKNKLVYSEISTKGQFAFDNTGLYCPNTAYILTTDSHYILALLNSKLTTYFLKQISAEIRGGFLRWTKQYVENLPICNATKKQQESLAQKAEQMIELNKKAQEQIKSALNLIQAEYQPKKISQKIEKFYDLGINPFMEELKKQGVKLSLTQKQELIYWYNSTSKKINDLHNEINTFDNLINQEVYKLYGLTDKEIQIIEGS